MKKTLLANRGHAVANRDRREAVELEGGRSNRSNAVANRYRGEVVFIKCRVTNRGDVVVDASV